MKRRSFLKRAIPGLPFIAARNPEACASPNGGEIRITIPEGLRQEVWEIAREPGLLSRLCPEARHYEEDGSVSYAYAFYVKSENHVAMIDWFVSSCEMVSPRLTFGDFITCLAPKTWRDLMFGFSLYRMCISEWTTPMRFAREEPLWNDPLQNWPRFRPMRIVDALLKDSRGAILWAEQLHGLYILCDPDRDAAIRFRKALHAGRTEARARLRELHFPDGTSLEEVIDDRMIFGHTGHPHYRGLRVVAEHFVH